MFKRIIYLLLSIIIFFVGIFFVYYLFSSSALLFLLFIGLYYVVNVGVSFIISRSFYDKATNFFFNVGIFTINYKRVYSKDFGYFWCEFVDHDDDGLIIVYEQQYFILKEKFRCHYDGDIDNFKKNIKSELDKLYISRNEKP